jgi:hypothetical protein
MAYDKNFAEGGLRNVASGSGVSLTLADDQDMIGNFGQLKCGFLTVAGSAGTSFHAAQKEIRFLGQDR